MMLITQNSIIMTRSRPFLATPLFGRSDFCSRSPLFKPLLVCLSEPAVDVGNAHCSSVYGLSVRDDVPDVVNVPYALG